MVRVIKGMKSSDLIKIIERDGWLRCHQKGSYCQFKHPMKAGMVTIPHPRSWYQNEHPKDGKSYLPLTWFY